MKKGGQATLALPMQEDRDSQEPKGKRGLENKLLGLSQKFTVAQEKEGDNRRGGETEERRGPDDRQRRSEKDSRSLGRSVGREALKENGAANIP